MADSQTTTGPPPASVGNADPVLAALAAEKHAAKAYEAALAALDQANAFEPVGAPTALIAWELYKREDLAEAEVQAAKALGQAERGVLSAKPQSVQGATAQLGFMRRYIADDPGMPASAHRIITTITNLEEFLLGTLGWQWLRQSATQ